ncbi:ComEC/Rec2 family competence protein [Algoriphagus aestuarii]|nr:ComEC/Rec2 family competence protein [Algoriphagus aestuarii]
MRFSDFPFLRYLPFLLMGIIGDRYFQFKPVFWLITLGVAWILYFLGLLIFRKQLGSLGLASLAYVCLFLFGGLLASWNKKTFENKDWTKADGYLAEVIQYDLEKPNSRENILEVRAIIQDKHWENASGKVLIYHQMEVELSPGMILYVVGIPEPVEKPTNPSEFDYAAFLARKGIENRHFIGKKAELIGIHPHQNLKYWTENLRHLISEQLKEKIPDSKSNQIAQALLLGQKQFLDQDTKSAYSQSGVMHVLAVSGLHVGIIYVFLMYLIKPFGLKKVGLKSYLILVVCCIWLYALLTGMSPSVLRAATMFTLITFGQMRERKPSIFNVLAFSAILMITVTPDVIYEVGFQLSYLAVGGIVLIHPLISRLWTPDTKVSEYIWQLIVVSISAQLATFPLTVYYFHSFPTYFLLGNLVVIPMAFLIMQVGVPLVIFGWIPYLSDFLGILVSYLVFVQSWLIEQIQKLPHSVLDRLTISVSTMMLVWMLLLFWAAWEEGQKRKLVWLALILSFVWVGARLFDTIVSPSDELLIYQTENGMIMDLVSNGNIRSWNSGVKPDDIRFKVDPYRLSRGWGLIPEPLSGIETNRFDYYFPLEGLRIAFDKKELDLSEHPPRSILIWEEGRWQDMPVTEKIKVGSNAMRILF